MKKAMKWFVHGSESMAAMMMAAMFATFILQITIRYTGRVGWIAARFPFLDTSHFGWTLEFCLALWVWLIFFGNSFVVRERDHVTFDLLYFRVNPTLRKWFAIFAGLVLCMGLLWSLEPTWSKFRILRLKKTASLAAIMGDGIRMLHIYVIYLIFLVIVALRYAWRTVRVFRFGADLDHHQKAIEKPTEKANDKDLP